MNKWIISIVLIVLTSPFALFGQIQTSEEPPSFSYKLRETNVIFDLPALDNRKLELEAINEKKKCATCKMSFYGKQVDFKLDVLRNSSRTKVEGGIIHRIKLKSPSAKGIQFEFSEFIIPKGGKLFVYSSDRKYVYGAYTEKNNHPTNTFATRIVPGDSYILEYFEPAGNLESQIVIGSIIHVFVDLTDRSSESDTGFGKSGSCTVNVACDNAYSLVSQAVALWSGVGSGGLARFCSGALVNSDDVTKPPYFFSAGHCVNNGDVNQYFSNVFFYFDYQSEDCENPPVDPMFTGVTLQGAYLKSRADRIAVDVDYSLFELNNRPQSYFNVAYLGWNNTDRIWEPVVNVSHPRADIKKGAWSNNMVKIDSWEESYDNCHGKTSGFRGYELECNAGSTDIISSGSPLVNEDYQLVGVLQGGLSVCADSPESNNCGQQTYVRGPDWFSRMDYIWQHPRPGWPSVQSILSPQDPTRTSLGVYNPPDPHPDIPPNNGPTCDIDIEEGFLINGSGATEGFACVDEEIILTGHYESGCYRQPRWVFESKEWETYNCNNIPAALDDDLCSRKILVPWNCECSFYRYKIQIQEVNAAKAGIGPVREAWFRKQTGSLRPKREQIVVTPAEASSMEIDLEHGKYYYIGVSYNGVHYPDERHFFRYMSQGNRVIESNPSEDILTTQRIDIVNTTISSDVDFIAGNSIRILSHTILTDGKYWVNSDIDCNNVIVQPFARNLEEEPIPAFKISQINIQNPSEFKYNVYPNSSSNGLFNITLMNEKSCDIQIFDINGKFVGNGYRVSESEAILDVRHYGKGMYVVKISTPAASYSERVIFN